MPDDVDLTEGVDRQRRVVGQGIDGLVHPAGAVICHIMNAAIVAHRPVKILDVYEMFYTCRVDDQAGGPVRNPKWLARTPCAGRGLGQLLGGRRTVDKEVKLTG